MPLYRFECDGCGDQTAWQMSFEEHDEFAPGGRGPTHAPARKCQGRYMQVFDFHVNLGMREHYSDQLDMHVTSERQFNSEMSRQQDEYQQRTGLDAKFETIDPGDMVAAGATDSGLEEQARAHHDEASDGHRSIFT